MRVIIKKNSGGSQLNIQNQNPPVNSSQASSRWKAFHKASVLAVLLDEQYGLCCYSEIRADLEGLGYHIEHVRPKSMYPAQTFDYSNLAASALTSDDLSTLKAIKGATFGGHIKGNDYDVQLFISCHDTDCDRYFAYLSDGRVVASNGLSSQDQARAIYMIDLLNLNSPYLINLRRRWYDELDQLFEDHINKNWDIQQLAAIDLIPSNRRLSQFFSLTKQFFGNTAELVIQQHLLAFT